MSKSDCVIITTVSLVVLIGLYVLCLGITEAIFLDKYDSAEIKGKCWQVWPNLVLLCVLNFISFFAALLSICDDDKSPNKAGGGLTLGFLAKIWTLIIFFNIDDNCIDGYKDKAPELWTLLQVEAITELAFIGIAGLIIVGAIGFCCFAMCKSCCESKNDHNSSSTAQASGVGATFGHPRPTTVPKTAVRQTAPPAPSVSQPKTGYQAPGFSDKHPVDQIDDLV
jgi:uncharacterized membrane protein HdeD (DUF308 family)